MTQHSYNVIVPLAGPDYITPGFIKGLHPVGDSHLLKYCLDSRPWSHLDSINYIFVLMESPDAHVFFDEYLSYWFPSAKVSFISSPTRGAALSVLPALALLENFLDIPIIIDLADIKFSSYHLPFLSPLSASSSGFAYYFNSSESCYSYFDLDPTSGLIKICREKQVISNFASAGVYAYRNASLYLKALQHTLDNPLPNTYNGLFYVCPVFNGLISHSGDVIGERVYDVCDIKVL